jgi:hypothetical protein
MAHAGGWGRGTGRRRRAGPSRTAPWRRGSSRTTRTGRRRQARAARAPSVRSRSSRGTAGPGEAGRVLISRRIPGAGVAPATAATLFGLGQEGIGGSRAIQAIALPIPVRPARNVLFPQRIHGRAIFRRHRRAGRCGGGSRLRAVVQWRREDRQPGRVAGYAGSGQVRHQSSAAQGRDQGSPKDFAGDLPRLQGKQVGRIGRNHQRGTTASAHQTAAPAG